MDTILGCRKAKPYDVYLSKAVKRVFRSDTKDYVTVCAVGRSAFVRCPATSAVEMRIRRSVLHLELQCMPGKNFSLEANVTVSSKRSAKKLDVRFAFSSTIERLSVKKSFAQLPLDMSSLLRHTDGSVGSSAEDSPEASQSCDSPPWIHVFLNFQALVHKLYGKKMGFRFEAVHSLQINAHVKLRRVYFTDSVQPVPGPTPAPESITGAPSVPLLDLTLLDHPDGELLVNASLLSDRHNSSADSSSTFASPLVPRHRNTEQRPASPLHEFEARDVAAGQSQDELLDNENDASSEDSSNQRNFREEDKSNPAGSTSADDPGLADDEGVAAASNPLKSDTSFNPWDNGRSSASMSARRAALQQRAAPTLAQRRATSGDTEHDIPALPKPTGQNDLLRSTDSLLEEIEAQQRKIAAMVDGDDGPDDREASPVPDSLLGALSEDDADAEDEDLLRFLNGHLSQKEPTATHDAESNVHAQPDSFRETQAGATDAFGRSLNADGRPESLYPDHPNFFLQKNPSSSLSSASLPDSEYLAYDPVLNAMVDIRTGDYYALRLFVR